MSYLFVALVGICMVVMDIVSNYQFRNSIFINLPEKYHQWWDNNPDSGSWLNKYNDRVMAHGRRKISVFTFKFNYPVQFLDAWHFFKMISIVFICLAIICYKPLTSCKALDFAIAAASWNFSFSLFYNRIFRKTKSNFTN